MSGTTLSACEAGLVLATEALVHKGWSKQTLANKTFPPDRDGKRSIDPISYKTVQNFFSGKAISLAFFHAICDTLDLDWQRVTGVAEEPTDQQAPGSSDDTPSIVQNIVQNNGNAIGQVNGNVYL